MIIKSIELADYRNYDSLVMEFCEEPIFFMVIMLRERLIF